jgi:mono/diheme cytochrome c family protein
MRLNAPFPLLALLLVTSSSQATEGSNTANTTNPSDTPALYQQHCAACHGNERLGAMGPALLPESLERLKKAEASRTIREGRTATQMPGFASTLDAAAIERLSQWIYTPVTPSPRWEEAQIRASYLQHQDIRKLPAKPVFKADPMNLFIVVEAGDHSVSILDGDKLEPIHRFASRYALHGGPKFSPEGCFVYFASRDGWISKFDLWNLKLVSEVRAGINTRNVAVSSDGKVVAVANYLPNSLVLLDADLKLIKVIPATTLDGKQSSRISAVYDAGPRQSFVAAMKDIPELWEISYNPQAEPVFDGFVHNYNHDQKMTEGLGKPGYLYPRRTRLDAVLDDFYFDQSYSLVMGTTREAASNGANGQVINLDIRQRVAELNVPGMPHLGSGITWLWQAPSDSGPGKRVMATPNLKSGLINVIDMQTWQTIKSIPTAGPGFFIRSHENSPYAWTDAMMSPYRNTLYILDKRTLEIIGNVRAEAGQTLAHVEFTRDGRYVLASLGERKDKGGAIIVYDATTFKEIKRLPMDKPVGKYNLHNKLTRSEGTSH